MLEEDPGRSAEPPDFGRLVEEEETQEAQWREGISRWWGGPQEGRQGLRRTAFGARPGAAGDFLEHLVCARGCGQLQGWGTHSDGRWLLRDGVAKSSREVGQLLKENAEGSFERFKKVEQTCGLFADLF